MPGSKGNKNAEKWTEEKLNAIGDRLIKWISQPGEDNLFFTEFLRTEGIYYHDFLSDNKYAKKFASFFAQVKKAKEIQKDKLLSMGLRNKLNPTLTIFVTSNMHGMTRKDEVTHKIPDTVTVKYE